MNKFLFSLPFAAGLILAGCGGDNGNNQVISKRYLHKYGYAVSESEWDSNNYPGQVITSLRNGVTVTSTYENGTLHGPCTHTHPHSQTVQYYYLYDLGELKKEVVYDVFGMPVKEMVQLSPHRYCLTTWYGDGNPKSTEDYASDELLDGKYYSLNNDVESTVDRGNGLRISRDQNGTLVANEEIEKGYLVKREAYHPNGNLESITHYKMGVKDGERQVYTLAGLPHAVENWVNGNLDGKATYFNNGKKQVEVFFVNGTRNGTEKHFVDGEQLESEIHWIFDKRHGPTKFYVGDNVAKTEWYYDNKAVSKRRFDELTQLDMMITNAPRFQNETSVH